MKKETALIEQKRGIRRIVKDVVEFIKSKIDKKYTLSVDSPEFLKRNKDLILKTIQTKTPYYLDGISEDLLLEELEQEQLPIGGIIDSAFKRDYELGSNSPKVLFGEKAKNAILHYIQIQPEQDKYIRKNRFSSDTQKRINMLMRELSIDVYSEMDVEGELTDLIIAKGYKIDRDTPQYLLQNATLVEKYYKDLLDKISDEERSNEETILSNNILSPELIKNKEFVNKYIDMLTKKGISNQTILETLLNSPESINVIRNDLDLFQNIFENIQPSDLADFFGKFFNKEEIAELLGNKEKLQGSLLRLSNLFSKDETILNSLNGKLLDEKYSGIKQYKLQIISKNTEVQDQILGLSDFELNLYLRMTELVDSKTSRWNRFDNNILMNFSDGDYGALISDLYEQAKMGNKITTSDLEKLTFLFSKKCVPKVSHDYLIENAGFSEEQIQYLRLANSNNIFRITTKKELENFEEIKEVVCDTVLVNPNLDSEELTGSIKKYLEKFEQLEPLDRVKLALLQKNYNMSLEEAETLITRFGMNIDDVPISNEHQQSIVEQIRTIKNIYYCDDMEVLQQVGNMDILVQTDLDMSTFIHEEAQEMFEQLFKDRLYMPKDADKIESIMYNGKKIEVYNAGIEFDMIVKRVGTKDDDSQHIWNSMTKPVEGRQDLRYRTCTSYMTAENLLHTIDGIEVTMGFAQGCKDYSFDAMYTHDAHTSFYGGDKLYEERSSNCRFITPEALEANTEGRYNEIVINTLSYDSDGRMTKMQPDYIVYIQETSDMTDEEKEQDPIWVNSKRVASEFGIPIVIIDREKVQENQRKNIAVMSETIKGKPSTAEILRFVQMVEHYTSRYGNESILEYAPKEWMDMLTRESEIKRKEEMGTQSFDIAQSSDGVVSTTDRKANVIKRQNELKAANIIPGDDGR